MAAVALGALYIAYLKFAPDIQLFYGFWTLLVFAVILSESSVSYRRVG